MRSLPAVAIVLVLLMAGCATGAKKTSEGGEGVGAVGVAIVVRTDVPMEGEPVRFEVSTDANLTGWSWEFGDGTVGSEPAPSHVYAHAGSYVVNVTVTDPQGATGRDSAALDVGRPARGDGGFKIDFRFSIIGSTVEFEPIVVPSHAVVDRYHWDFGDGDTSADSAPAHAYGATGLFTVVLRASSNATISQAEHTVGVGVVSTDGNPLANKSFVVIAIVDTGINPYHSEFRDDAFVVPPSQYVTDYPADATALPLSLDERTYSGALKKDEAVWSGVKASKLYWVPGTRIIGAISLTQDGAHKILDDDGHGTATASDAAGATVGTCPRCLIVVVEGLGDASLQWALRQPWIDVVSNSWSECLFTCDADTGLLPGQLVDPTNSRVAVEAGKEILFAAGNGVLNGFDAPTLTYYNAHTGPDWVLTVGAADTQSGAIIAGTGRPVDVVSYGLDWRAAAHQSTNSIVPFSGTSAATPVVAGAYAYVVREARELLGDRDEGPRHGSVARGAPLGGMLADGVLSRAEAERALLLTAKTGGSVGPVYPASLPGSPAAFVYAGYGLVNAASAKDAVKVVTGAAPVPARPNEDQWAAVDSRIRQALWGPYDPGADGTRFVATHEQVERFLDALDGLVPPS